MTTEKMNDIGVSSTANDGAKMVLRTKDGVSAVYDVVAASDDSSADVRLVESAKVMNTSFTCCSPNGLHVFFQTSDKGVVRHCISAVEEQESSSVDGADHQRSFLKDSKGVQFIAFSPLGSYLVTYERPLKPSSEGDAGKIIPNVKVWDAITAPTTADKSSGSSYIFGTFCKTFSRSTWPYIRWSSDETYCLVLSSAAAKEIQIYKNNDFHSCLKKVRMPGSMEQLITSFSIAPSNSKESSSEVVFHAFSPEKKGHPSKFAILGYPDRLGGDQQKRPPIAYKSFFQAEEVTVKWSPRGDMAIVLTQTSVDTTGDSYYGSTQLHLFQTTTTTTTDDTIQTSNESIQVPLAKVGPVLSVEWCPDTVKKASTFVVISGKMPALAALYNGITGQPIYIFGEQHRNTISWSPSGRFLCLAGFGNLAGGMDFIDINKYKKIPQYHSTMNTDEEEEGEIVENEILVTYGNTAKPAGSFGWSSDSRMFHVSTMAPRMNVDNGVRIYKYNGYGPICDYPLLPDKLLSAEFLPPRLGKALVDRPQSPPPRRIAKLVEQQQQEGKKHTSSGTTHSISHNAAAAAAAAAPVQAYVPPSARRATNGAVGSGSSGGSLAERLRREKESQTIGAMKVVNKLFPFGSSSPAPGSSIVTGRSIPGLAPISNKSSGSKKSKPKRPAVKKQENDEEQKDSSGSKLEGGKKETTANIITIAPVDPEKRVKKINKMLKQIEELKVKDPLQLNDDQKNKVDSESMLLEELKTLNIT